MASSELGSRVLRLLKDLECAQGKLQSVFAVKRTVLTNGTAKEIAALTQSESQVVAHLRELLKLRQQILGEAKRQGVSAGTLRELTPRVLAGDRASVLARMDRFEEQMASLRREGWGHWIVANRNYHHHTDLLDLIAYHGKAAPTYSRKAPRTTAGGAILDTSI